MATSQWGNAGLFKSMDGFPVVIRTLDPPLHEFNPMLGHRGCRLGITYPEITEVQARAIGAGGPARR